MMIEIREITDNVCPRCGSREVYTVTEIEDMKSMFYQKNPTKYTACFSKDENGEICWYHLKADYFSNNKRTRPETCKVDGCNSTDFVYGRFICHHHYNEICKTRYHRKRAIAR